MLTHTIEQQPDQVRLVLAGDLDLATRDRLRAALDQTLGLRPHRLVVDLAAVGFLDCTSITVLLAARLDLAAAGGRLQVVNPRGVVQWVLKILDLIPFLAGGADPAVGTAG